ncbi:MAG: recombination regulator RecX [Burkholderiaceae bacterium]|nr:recombination regulator RecX [Burkholderiaceae bacterium]
MAAAAPTLKARALRLLARRDYTRHELAQRLAPHAADAAELEAVLDDCARRGWLDEARALEAHLHRRAARWGSARVQAELRARGVADAELLQAAQQRLAATEAERAQAVWQQRFGHAPADAAERARQLRFLLARGFAPEVARRTVPRVGSAGHEVDEFDDA